MTAAGFFLVMFCLFFSWVERNSTGDFPNWFQEVLGACFMLGVGAFLLGVSIHLWRNWP